MFERFYALGDPDGSGALCVAVTLFLTLTCSIPHLMKVDFCSVVLLTLNYNMDFVSHGNIIFIFLQPVEESHSALFALICTKLSTSSSLGILLIPPNISVDKEEKANILVVG